MRRTRAWVLAGSPPSSPRIRRTGCPLSPPRAVTSATQARAPWKNGAIVAPRIPLWTPNDPSRISASVAPPPAPDPVPGADGRAPPPPDPAAVPAAPPAPAPEPAPGRLPPGPAGAPDSEPGMAAWARPAAPAPARPEPDTAAGALPVAPADPVAATAGEPSGPAAGRAGDARSPAAPAPGEGRAPAGAPLLPAGRRPSSDPSDRARRSRGSREPQPAPTRAQTTATTRAPPARRPPVPDIHCNMSVQFRRCQCARRCMKPGFRGVLGGPGFRGVLGGRSPPSVVAWSSSRDVRVALMKHSPRTLNLSRCIPVVALPPISCSARPDGGGTR